jgi:hypothetical protein
MTFVDGGSASSAALRSASPQRIASFSALRSIAWMRRTDVGDRPPSVRTRPLCSSSA